MLPESFTPHFLRQLELLKIRARRAFLGTRQGGHVSLKRGHGIEFADYRQYELGDNPRHIDWGVYARSDRLYVKKFQEEQDLNIYIIIDTSASMFNPAGDRKWETARDIAIALSYVALMEQDSVTILAPGVMLSPAYYGGRAIHELGRTLLKLEPKPPLDFRKSMQQTSARMRFPGVAIVLSDFLMAGDEVREMFNVLRARNMDITAIQVLGPNDVNPLPQAGGIRVVDSETGEEVELNLTADVREEYGALLAEHIGSLQEYFASAHISYVQAVTTQSLSDFVVQKLSETGLLR